MDTQPQEVKFDIGSDSFSFEEIMMMIDGSNEEAAMCVEALNEDDLKQFEALKSDFELPENKESIARIIQARRLGKEAENKYAEQLYKKSGLYKSQQKKLAEVNRQKSALKKRRQQQKKKRKQK